MTINGNQEIANKSSFDMTQDERDKRLEELAGNFKQEEVIQEEQKEDENLNPELEALKAELEKEKKRNHHQKDFIDRQGQEIGVLRAGKQKKEIVDGEDFSDIFEDEKSDEDDINSKVNNAIEKNKTDELKKELEKKEIVEKSKEYLTKLSKLNSDELLKQSIVLLKEDGFTDEHLKNIEKEFFTYGLELTHQIVKRVTAVNKIKELEEEIVGLKEKPNRILDGIQRASKTKPLISPISSNNVNTLKAAFSMTREERDKRLEELENK